MHNRSAGEKNIVNTINYLILCEHEPVYTLGKSGKVENLKIEPDKVGADFYHTTRGGDITFHGPGQLVCYPIFDLEQFGFSLRAYVEKLEEVVIRLLSSHGLKADRLDGAAGVWLDANGQNARKICAVGVRASRYVTMHGLALNVNTDLEFFNHIIPCGIDDKPITSLEKELGEQQDMETLKNRFLKIFREVFDMQEYGF
jgi:lipoyl(octanoyl) transferase